MALYLITFICVILLISPVTSISQTVNFEKFFAKTQILYSVQQTADNGYILSGIETEGENIFTKLIKTDETGDTVWTRKYPGIGTNSHYKTMAVQTLDGGYALTGSVEEPDNLDISLIKTDPQGELSWQKVYGKHVDELSWTIEQTADKGYLVTANTEDWKFYIIKTDSLGVLQWDKEIGPISSFDRRSQAIQTSDLGYVIVSKPSLFKLDVNGDSSWAKTYENSFNHVQENNDQNLILAGRNVIMKTDSLGEEIWLNQEISLNSNDLSLTNDGGCILNEYQLLKIDENGEEQWRIDVDGSVYSVTQTNDEGYAYCGDDLPDPFFDLGWFVKTDQNGYYQSLILYSPEDGNQIWYNQDYLIAWRQINVEQIQISFSSNNGLDWSEIVESHPASIGSYSWQVPFLISDQCKIRLTTVDQPELTSENEDPFSILYNNAYDFIAVNQIKMWFSNNGDGSHNPYTDNAGFYWPGGADATTSAVFEDGLVFSGLIHGNYYAGGNTHFQGLQAGNILKDGSAGNPDSLIYKVWKIRRDWDVFPPGPEKDRLEHDYHNWPVQIGAPWIDNNGDGVYDPEIDQPKLYGDETNWMIMNDLDSSRTESFGSDPTGLEIHSTVYGYDRQDLLADVIFKSYKVINKGQKFIEDLALGYWSDADLGSAADDFVGCDTLLDLQYVYNAKNEDELYGSPAPAVGYILLQGPIEEGSAEDSAWTGENWVTGYKNLPMTSFMGYT
jgi:hypothetical protein